MRRTYNKVVTSRWWPFHSRALDAIANEAFGAAGTTQSDLTGQSQLFFVATFALLAKVAMADSTVSVDELSMLDHLLKHHFKCSPPAQRLAVRIFTAARDSQHSLPQIARAFRRAFHRHPTMLDAMFGILFDIAFADDHLDEGEARALATVANIFGIHPEITALIEASHSAEPHLRPYARLRCAPDSPMSVVQAQYDRLITTCDPQAALSAGLPGEFVELLNSQAAELQQAFSRIKSERRGDAHPVPN